MNPLVCIGLVVLFTWFMMIIWYLASLIERE